jgi:uncharacterized protein
MVNSVSKLKQIADSQPYPLIFATVSGAHLYGFASHDSDYDLRGSHVLPLQQTVGLYPSPETIEVSKKTDDLELDLVTHDVQKFFNLLLKRNGYVLEQLYSPLIIHTTPEHKELKEISLNCLTRHHVHHYLGFAKTQWRLFTNESPPKVKPLLYLYRVLLTGIYLMQTGKIEANLNLLNQEFNLSYIPELVAQKTAGIEKAKIENINREFHQREYDRLREELALSSQNSHLPDTPTAKPALNDLLIRIRLELKP